MNDLMSTCRVSGTAYINEGDGVPARLTIEQEIQQIHTGLPQPDPSWEYTDRAGHYHAYDQAGDRARGWELPTLAARTERVECDGSCNGVCEGEGYDVTRYSCRICNEDVTPGLSPGPHSFTIPGLKNWRVEVDALVSGHDPVSVRVEVKDGLLFGVAVPGDSQVESDFSGMRATTTLIGTSSLGKRQARSRTPTRERVR